MTQIKPSFLYTYRNWFSLISVCIIVFVIWYNYQSKQSAKETAGYITAPMIGDIVSIKAGEDKYVLLKLLTIKPDSVFFRANNYQSNSAAGLAPLKDSSFAGDISYLSKMEYKKMYERGEILQVDRKPQ